MRIRKKLWYLPIFSIVSFLTLIYVVFSFAPDDYMLLSNFQFTVLPIGLLLLFVFSWSLFRFIFADKIQGLLLALLLIIYLILRLNNLTQTFFLVMLVLIFVGFELLIFRKK